MTIEYGVTLNSNLILLIRYLLYIRSRMGNNFKFQSDSINTTLFAEMISGVVVFKFQSDSINTLRLTILKRLLTTLNSNLILLIRKGTIKLPGDEIVFKFQSDSINTLSERGDGRK